ncbi:hypothetical protein M3D15_10120 [Pseudoclavibacter alba]|uniref:Replication protein n=1 Tax=Pseudoclavibacter albus TaxID=272241 RepID=A0ABT2HZC3_9MICO|nr:hypothetical protein [Pseudoclavibacter alba]
MTGVPVDMDSYDYAGQVRWNRDHGALWRRTNIYLRRSLPEFDYAVVREFQKRGAIHLHVLLRLPAGTRFVEAKEAIERVVESVSVSPFDSEKPVVWGEQVDVQDLGLIGVGRAVEESASRAVRYIGKVIGYVAKTFTHEVSLLRSTPQGRAAMAHQEKLRNAAHKLEYEPKKPMMTKEWPEDPEYPGLPDVSKPYEIVKTDTLTYLPERNHSGRKENFGAANQVVTVSRKTNNRRGWSIHGLTRKKLHEERKQYAQKLALWQQAADETWNSVAACMESGEWDLGAWLAYIKACLENEPAESMWRRVRWAPTRQMSDEAFAHALTVHRQGVAWGVFCQVQLAAA